MKLPGFLEFSTMLQRKVLWLAYMVFFQDNGSCVDGVHCWQHRGLLELADVILQRGAGGRERERERGRERERERERDRGGCIHIHVCDSMWPCEIIRPYKKKYPTSCNLLFPIVTLLLLLYNTTAAMNRLHVMNQCLIRSFTKASLYLKLFLEAKWIIFVQLVENDAKVANSNFSLSTSDTLIQSIMDEYILRLYACMCVCVYINIRTIMNKINDDITMIILIIFIITRCSRPRISCIPIEGSRTRVA